MKENSRVGLYLLRTMQKLVKKECTCKIGKPKCLRCVLSEKLTVAENMPAFLELWKDCVDFWEDACKDQRHIYRDEECVWKLAEVFQYSHFIHLVNNLGDGILCKLLETSFYSNPPQEIREFLVNSGLGRASSSVKSTAQWLAEKWHCGA